MIRIRQCEKNSNHWHSIHTQNCPWCKLYEQSSFDSFPPSTDIQQSASRSSKVYNSHYSVPERKEVVLVKVKPPEHIPIPPTSKVFRWSVGVVVAILIIIYLVFIMQTTPVSAATAISPDWSSPTGSYGGADISSDGQKIVDGDYYGNIHYYNGNGDLIWSYPAKGNSPVVALSSDGQYVAIGTSEWGANKNGSKKISLVNKEGKLLWSYPTERDIHCIAISSDGNYIAGGSLESQSVNVNDNKIFFFSREGNLLWEYTTDYVESIAISSDGRYIAAISGPTIFFFSSDGKLLWSSKVKGWLRSLAISADGKAVFVGSADNNVYYYSSDGIQRWKYSTGDWVESVSLSSDGHYAVAGSRDHKVYFFAADGKVLWNALTDAMIGKVAVSADGRYIISGVSEIGDVSPIQNKVYYFSQDGKAQWSSTTGGWVSGVALSSDGRYVVVVSDRTYYFHGYP